MKENGYPYIEVVFAVPVRQAFTYAVPEHLQQQVKIGCRVEAPFGKRNEIGYIVSHRQEKPREIQKIKPITRQIDEIPIFEPSLLPFLDWVANYYLCSRGEVYAAAYPFSPDIQPKKVTYVILKEAFRNEPALLKGIKGEAQNKVIAFLLENPGRYSPSQIAKRVGVSPSPIKTLQQNGVIELVEAEEYRGPTYSSHEITQQFQLTQEQEQCIAHIETALDLSKPKPILIQGVTGSGKTEIYLQAIHRVLRRGKNALVLIPEIALTPQTMDRFRQRFGAEVGILHSGLGAGERYDEWRLARQGKRRIIVGTRSAVFAPIKNVGIVIVDEEHESSYKQSDPNPRYNGRDLAVVRAQFEGALCLLGSATPAIESTHNTQKKKYQRLKLTQRISSHGMPQMTLLDMRGRVEDEEIFATEMQKAIADRFEKKQQTILFLNRRGFSTTLTCKRCGKVLSCKHCSVAMVYHKSSNLLICHHCDFRMPMPSQCPYCEDPFIRQRGFGTERVVQELETLLPDARLVRLDRDTTARKGEHDRLLSQFRRGEADIMVGTQMIAKGLDFPNVTLVGIINADYSLSLPDFRASERTYILLTQVAGRAGRGTHAGEVLIQSYCPDHFSMQLALQQKYETFFEKEIRYRRIIGFPPFTRLVLWRVESTKEDIARDKAWTIYEILKEGAEGNQGITILPPVEAPIYRIRDYYRWMVALKSKDYQAYRPLVQDDRLIKIMNTQRKGLRIIQDVDPWDML